MEIDRRLDGKITRDNSSFVRDFFSMELAWLCNAWCFSELNECARCPCCSGLRSQFPLNGFSLFLLFYCWTWVVLICHAFTVTEVRRSWCRVNVFVSLRHTTRYLSLVVNSFCDHFYRRHVRSRCDDNILTDRPWYLYILEFLTLTIWR